MAVQMSVSNKLASQRKLQEKVDSPAYGVPSLIQPMIELPHASLRRCEGTIHPWDGILGAKGREERRNAFSRSQRHFTCPHGMLPHKSPASEARV